MSSWRSAFAAIIAGVAVWLTPALASAQPITLPMSPAEASVSGDLSSLTFFFSADAGYTPFKAEYEGSKLARQLSGIDITGTNTDFTFKEREQRLMALGGTAGLRWQPTDAVHLLFGVGVSWLELQEENTVQVQSGNYNNEHREFRRISPNPGFSATLGIDLIPVQRPHLAFVLGAQVIYLSAFGLRGNELTGTDIVLGGAAAGSTQIYAQTNTTDLNLQLLTFLPHVGLEWRPRASWATNTFGLFSTYVLSFGSMEKRFRFTSEDYPNVGNASTSAYQETEVNLDMKLAPIQFLGAYYGWTFAIPRVGSIGLEVQFGTRWNGNVNYQYSF